MTPPLRFTERAKDDIDHAAWWYAQQRPGLDGEFLAELGELLGWVRSHPKTPALVSSTLRIMPLGRFPYVVSYRLTGREVLVIRVVHQRRHPRHRLGRGRSH